MIMKALRNMFSGESNQEVNKVDSKNEVDSVTYEIERKFLMASFPCDDLYLLGKSNIEQSYISTEPEVRLRRIDNGSEDIIYKRTFKGSGNMVRTEKEENITAEEYEEQLEMINLEPIIKEYRRYTLEDGNIFEVSKVDNDFYYGEVEFASEDRAKAWEPQDNLKKYIIKEVTYDDAYKMKNYWTSSRLD